jgi:NAD(P)-dependent dehydrogenase (short-subunit alcohol dehydrogenase family)
MEFSGKIVLVTGASRGIGRAIAQQFAERGATIGVHFNRNAAAAEETLKLLPGDGHSILQADIADPAAVKNMVDTCVQRHGSIDVLVNNAGIFEDHPPASVDYDTWQAHWQATINTNLIGAANTAYCAAQHMIKQGGGRIVNVSSRGAFRGEPTAPAYGASKAGMNAMSQSLAQALAPHNIFVTTVAPGWVATDMAEGQVPADIAAQSPLNRIAHPDEIARAVVFLASEGTDFLTGAIVDANGASYLRT